MTRRFFTSVVRMITMSAKIFLYFLCLNWSTFCAHHILLQDGVDSAQIQLQNDGGNHMRCDVYVLINCIVATFLSNNNVRHNKLRFSVLINDIYLALFFMLQTSWACTAQLIIQESAAHSAHMMIWVKIKCF